MENENMERCSTSYVIWERQIKIMRYHYMPMGMTQIWNTPDQVREQQKSPFIYIDTLEDS